MNMFKPNTSVSPEEYISKLEEPRRAQIQQLHDLIRKTVPEFEPFMISGMIGYGKYRYKSKSGSEGDWYVIGLASQKNYISLYVCAVDGDTYLAETYVDKFPKASIGKSCIRFKKIDDIDLVLLKELLQKSAALPALGQVNV